MCGVYDKATLGCENCKKDTVHNTGWESEEPNDLDTECTECGKREIRRA